MRALPGEESGKFPAGTGTLVALAPGHVEQGDGTAAAVAGVRTRQNGHSTPYWRRRDLVSPRGVLASNGDAVGRAMHRLAGQVLP
ncbi:hypothetical protein UK82_08250 [Frankia sp. ACN1ag]|nr:hypothetical protein UK82_08250 [Frankia sp. ACN1ag]